MLAGQRRAWRLRRACTLLSPSPSTEPSPTTYTHSHTHTHTTTTTTHTSPPTAHRYLLRELVTTYLTRQFPKWTAIDAALEAEGWKLVTLLRLSPIAPWNVLNYALAVTAVPLAPYFIASSLAVSEGWGGVRCSGGWVH